MSNLPKLKIKEFFKNLFALLFMLLLVMAAGYFAGKKIESVGNNRQSEGWTAEDQAKWLEDMKNLEQRIKMLEEKDKTGENTAEKKVALKTEEIIAMVCSEAGVPVEDCLRVAWNESRYQNIRGKIDPRDRGVYQINSYWHPEISDDCAFDVACSTKFFISEYKKGKAHITWARTF